MDVFNRLLSHKIFECAIVHEGCNLVEVVSIFEVLDYFGQSLAVAGQAAVSELDLGHCRVGVDAILRLGDDLDRNFFLGDEMHTEDDLGAIDRSMQDILMQRRLAKTLLAQHRAVAVIAQALRLKEKHQFLLWHHEDAQRIQNVIRSNQRGLFALSMFLTEIQT